MKTQLGNVTVEVFEKEGERTKVFVRSSDRITLIIEGEDFEVFAPVDIK